MTEKKVFAIINTRSRGLLVCWPAHAVMGHWAITVPVPWVGDGELLFNAEYATMTHQPTGFRAGDCALAKDYTKRLQRLNALFGNAQTVKGVQRKFNALSDKDKRFVRGW